MLTFDATHSLSHSTHVQSDVTLFSITQLFTEKFMKYRIYVKVLGVMPSSPIKGKIV